MNAHVSSLQRRPHTRCSSAAADSHKVSCKEHAAKHMQHSLQAQPADTQEQHQSTPIQQQTMLEQNEREPSDGSRDLQREQGRQLSRPFTTSIIRPANPATKQQTSQPCSAKVCRGALLLPAAAGRSANTLKQAATCSATLPLHACVSVSLLVTNVPRLQSTRPKRGQHTDVVLVMPSAAAPSSPASPAQRLRLPAAQGEAQ
jgi:hypothetical protein